ncbi:hypothetical protein [Arenibacter certesii]|uniref:hypothetical protein n=1 Tax=Arenibacter certesii TaxID=228955 RepID=UPI0003FEBFA5|nr:hypothetical protein [Arenibacter certesii]
MKFFKWGEYSSKELLFFDNPYLEVFLPFYTTVESELYKELMLYFEEFNIN